MTTRGEMRVATVVLLLIAGGCADDAAGGGGEGRRTELPEARRQGHGAFAGASAVEALLGSPLPAADGDALTEALVDSAAELLGVKTLRGLPPARAQKDAKQTCLTVGAGSVTFDRCTYPWRGFVVDGELRFSADSIVGELSVEGLAAAPGGAGHDHFNATFDVERSGGCATGGAIAVSGIWNLGELALLDVPVHVVAEFGPACGDVTVH